MWTLLCEIDSTQSDRYGRKACRLVDPLNAGIPLPDSWVLSTELLTGLRGDPVLARSAARELLSLAPRVESFLLRSSSPHEDSLDQSAAGLFSSVPCAADEQSLVDGLREMAECASDPELARLLGLAPGTVSLAILAQEKLSLRVWATVECDGGRTRRSSLRVEGFARGPGCLLRFEFSVPSPESDGGWRERLGAEPAWMRARIASLDSLLALARQAVNSETGSWLLELGETGAGPVLLQRRPVARRAPARKFSAGVRTSLEEDSPFADFPLFAGDERKDWRHDAAHAPGPLCPLLAGLFARWILAKGEGHPTRLRHGRWYDRVSDEEEEPSEQKGEAARALEDALRDWTGRRIPRLRRGLAALEEDHSPLASPSQWPRFVREWLAWQSEYFDGAASRLRGAAAVILEDLRRRAIAPPPLPATVASEREREMDELAAGFQELDEARRERALEHFLTRHGHVTPGPTDGRGVPWREDPAPLLLELSRRAQAATRHEPSSDRKPSAPRAGHDDPAARLAVRALAALEDDDDLLTRAYALFRACALDLQAWIQPEAEGDEILELLPEDLEELLKSGPPCDGARFAEARARGGALVTRWEREFESESPWDSGDLTAGSTLWGQALAEGEAEGAPCILSSAQAEGGPPEGAILVVPLVLPSDAVVFSRCAALICESGMVLGHAAVLAREKGIPAVVLPGACRRLARVRRARVDGGRGRVEILRVGNQ